MEDFWDDSGPFALARLADRMVPIPRDNEPPVSLYTLCRAWVRNNPVLPLTADAPSPLGPRDAAARVGNGANSVDAEDGRLQDPTLQKDQEPRQNGLLSILPPQQGPTALETDTVAPSYPLDDFEAQEPEEALRKLKDHWGAVRQYHQSIRRAKLSRHRERLQVLLGEPSLLLHHHQQAAQMGLQSLHQQQAAMMGLGSSMALQAAPLGNGMGGLGQMGQGGSLLGPGGFGGGAMQGQVGPQGQSQMVSAADAQAALAAILNLTQGTGSLDPAGQPQMGGGGSGEGLGAPPQHQHQQLMGLPMVAAPMANGAAAGQGSAVALPAGSMEALMALQQQLTGMPQANTPQQLQQQQPAQQQQQVFGNLSAAVVAAAAGGQGQQPMDAAGAGAALAGGTLTDGQLPAQGQGHAGCEQMDIDTVVPNGT